MGSVPLTAAIVASVALGACAPIASPEPAEVVTPPAIETSRCTEPACDAEAPDPPPRSSPPASAPASATARPAHEVPGAVSEVTLPQQSDGDGDGVADPFDQCPGSSEDLDGHEDHDGCPDPDNDGDGIDDVADKCPGHAENVNGVEDQDGCPEGTVTTGSAESRLKQAREAFRAGMSAYQNGDYASARQHFESAYALAPRDPILFNLARTALEQGDRTAACRYYQKWKKTHKGAPAAASAELAGACP